MKTRMEFDESELSMLLTAMNIEREHQMEMGPPEQRKRATELRDRIAERVRDDSKWEL